MKCSYPAILLVCIQTSAFALPNMVRLGYPNCVSCHIDPQGGGLLNSYGKGIDEAQSLRAGEYDPADKGFLDRLSWNGRIEQDGRAVVSMQLSHTPGRRPYAGIDRYRLSYRNVTRIWKGLRVSAVIDGENESANRNATDYDPTSKQGRFGVRTALIRYLPKEGIEFAAGRDALPTGLNIPDLTTFIKARNRLGFYDTHQQVKAFFWGKSWQVAPYVFFPNGNEPEIVREKGVGIVAEYDLLGKGRTVVGTNSLHGSDPSGTRNVVGIYTRVGFGRWGVLAEHDFTDREAREIIDPVRFNQHASYAQIFFYPREWLWFSGVIERLSVEHPHADRLWAFKGELAMRFSSSWTIGVRSGAQRNTLTDEVTPIASIQLSLKPVR